MSDNSKHIIDIISDSVASLRKTNTVSGTVLLSGYSFTLTLDSINEYAVGDYITLSDGINTYSNCKVTAINPDYEIVVLNLDETTLTGITSAISNAPYFDYDHWDSESGQLLLKDNEVEKREQKYPLIYLLLNIKENRQENNANKSEIGTINIYLIKQTDHFKNTKWRHETNFPILRSLYDNFLLSLQQNYYINVSNYISHNYEELFFMGTEDRNQNKVNDYVDAIHLELTNLKIKKLRKC